MAGMAIMKRGSRWLAVLPVLCVALVGARCWAVTLRPGDIVQVETVSAISGMEGLVVRLDPSTLDTAFVSYGLLIRSPMAVAVDAGGRILVADANSGIVSVNPVNGAQSLLAGTVRLGGTPTGICAAPEGHLFVSVRGSAPGVVLMTGDGSGITPLSSGGLISYPGGLTLGPDGALYVAEGGLPADNGGTPPFSGHGSIVRVDAVTGAQTLIAADSLFATPFDIALVGPDDVWTLQRGYIAGRQGCFIRTHLGDGTSARAYDGQSCRSIGIAAPPGGAIVVSDCQTIGPDCYTRYTTRLPNGPTLTLFAGPMAVVPAGPVPVQHRSWGALKTIYH